MATCRSRAAVLALAVLALGGGCSGNDGQGVKRPAGDKPGQVTAKTETVPDPRMFAFGQSVQIDGDAFVPRQLVAIVGHEVIFENRSSKERTIEFFNGAIDDAGTVTSGPIPPGGGSPSAPPTRAASPTGTAPIPPSREECRSIPA